MEEDNTRKMGAQKHGGGQLGKYYAVRFEIFDPEHRHLATGKKVVIKITS